MAKDVASSLYYLSDVGKKTVSKYIYAETPAKNDVAGTVLVHDVVSGNPIAHFKAHSDALTLVCFDPSETLLVTASVSGHELNVFSIAPTTEDNVCSSHTHLYTLVRGYTSATIKDISFSIDSHWLAASSTRGTT